MTTAYGRLARIVRNWAEVNRGELNRVQVRELIRALDYLHEAEEVVLEWAIRSPS